MPIDKKIIPANFILSENLGFDLSPDQLTFGKIPINQSASRTIVIENNFNRTIKILIESSGEISKNLIVSENNFILNPLESKKVVFLIWTNGLTELKTYSGKVIIISNKFKN